MRAGQALTDTVWEKVLEGRAKCPKPEIYDWVYVFLMVNNYNNIHEYVTTKKLSEQGMRLEDKVCVVKIPPNPFDDQYVMEQSMLYIYSTMGVLMGMQSEINRMCLYTARQAEICCLCYEKAQMECSCMLTFCSATCKAKHSCST